MNSQTLALLNQTLRTDSRKLSVHLFLGFYVGALFLMVYLESESTNAVGAPGLELFRKISVINFVFLLFTAVFYLGTVISEEKEQGTLGLLKLTGLSPVVLLLGKSGSRIVFVLILLAMQLPFALFSITMGGVTLEQILGSYFNLTCFFFMSAMLGVFCSVFAKNSSSGMALALVLNIFYLISPSIMGALVREYMLRNPAPSQFIMYLNSIVKFFSVESVMGKMTQIMITRTPVEIFSPFVVICLLTGLLFFYFAVKKFESSTQEFDSPQSQPAENKIIINTSKEGQIWVDPAWKSAVAWKDFYFLTGGYATMLGKAIAYPAGAIGIPMLVVIFSSRISFSDVDDIRRMIHSFFLWGGLGFMGLEMILYLMLMYHHEIEEKTFANLILIPKSLFRITFEKVSAYLFSLIPVACCVILGLIIGADYVLESLGKVRLSSSNLLIGIAFLSGAIAYLHMIVFLSLDFKLLAFPVSLILFQVITSGFIYLMDFDFGGLYNYHIVSQALWFTAFYSGITFCLFFLTGKRLKTLAGR